MNVIFRFQDMPEVVNDEAYALEVNADDVQKVAYKEQKKKDGKGFFFIHQCVDPNLFETIIEEEMFKEAWDKLKNL